MRLVRIFLLALLSTLSLLCATRFTEGRGGEGGSNHALVEISTEEEFHDFVELGKPALVAFTAPWCGHCKKIYPLLKEVAAALDGESSDVTIPVANVNGEKLKALRKEHQVRGFPTLLMFKDDGSYEKYMGVRSVQDITRKMLKLASPGIVEVQSTVGAVEGFLQRAAGDLSSFLLLGATESQTEVFKKALDSLDLGEEIFAGAVSEPSADVLEQYGVGLDLPVLLSSSMRNGEIFHSDRDHYSAGGGGWTEAALAKYIKATMLPATLHLSNTNHRFVWRSGKDPVLLLFKRVDEQFRNAVHSLSYQFRETCQFVYVNAEDFPDFVNAFKPPELPHVVIYNNTEDSFVRLPSPGENRETLAGLLRAPPRPWESVREFRDHGLWENLSRKFAIVHFFRYNPEFGLVIVVVVFVFGICFFIKDEDPLDVYPELRKRVEEMRAEAAETEGKGNAEKKSSKDKKDE